MQTLKGKVNRDLTQQARETEDRIKAFKQLGDQQIQSIRDDTEQKMFGMNEIVTKCFNKVDAMLPTDEILKIVDNSIKDTLADLTNQVVELTDSVDKRFLKIYTEELWEEN